MIARLAYPLLPPWTVALHGRPAYSARATTALLRALWTALGVPTRLRWGWPESFALRAVDRLGPSARPSPRRPSRA